MLAVGGGLVGDGCLGGGESLGFGCEGLGGGMGFKIGGLGGEVDLIGGIDLPLCIL